MRARPIAVLVGGLFGLLAGTRAQESRVVELNAPRPLGRHEGVQLQVTTGLLPRSARLVVMTEAGEVLGAATPFGRGSTTAAIPVPRSALVDGRLRLRLEVVERGAPPRPPRPGEVERLDLVPLARSE